MPAQTRKEKLPALEPREGQRVEVNPKAREDRQARVDLKARVNHQADPDLKEKEGHRVDLDLKARVDRRVGLNRKARVRENLKRRASLRNKLTILRLLSAQTKKENIRALLPRSRRRPLSFLLRRKTKSLASLLKRKRKDGGHLQEADLVTNKSQEQGQEKNSTTRSDRLTIRRPLRLLKLIRSVLHRNPRKRAGDHLQIKARSQLANLPSQPNGKMKEGSIGLSSHRGNLSQKLKLKCGLDKLERNSSLFTVNKIKGI